MKKDSLGHRLKAICSESSPRSKRTYRDAFAAYGYSCPDEVTDLERIFSGGFLRKDDGEHWLFYGPEDMAQAEQHVPIDIRESGRVPLIDCKDNLFVCARPTLGRFVLFDPFGGGDVAVAASLYELLLHIGLFEEGEHP